MPCYDVDVGNIAIIIIVSLKTVISVIRLQQTISGAFLKPTVG